MKRIAGHHVGIAQGEAIVFSDFDHDGPMWIGQGQREARHKIRFDEVFREPPSVSVHISMWDISNGANNRADVTAEKITAKGFEIVFRTWGDTRVARVRVGWLAIGALTDDEQWDIP